jgi:glycosyltransferase involved in cell wall biosynthesis
MKKLTFSFIVPAHNEEDVIGKCLDSILKQKGNYEVIVVNDGSTDKTREIVEKYVKKYPKKIKLINFSRGHSAGFARNRGAEKARGEWIIFIDADQILEKNFLKKVENFLEKNPEIHGSDYLVYSHKPKTIFQRAWSAYRATYPSIGLIHIIKTKVFKKLNGFNEKIFYYEDTEFMERFHKAGYKFKGPINAAVYHIEPARWKDFLRQRKWQAKGVMHSFKQGKWITLLRYFGPLALLPLCLISWIPLAIYFLGMWLKFAIKSKQLVNSLLWVLTDYLGRMVSFVYLTILILSTIRECINLKT